MPRDYSRAMELYRRACEGRLGIGCEGMGTLFQHGWGVAKDRGRANELFRRACDLDARWCIDLAEVTLKSDGVPPNRALGMQLLGRACKAGNMKACLRAKGLGHSP